MKRKDTPQVPLKYTSSALLSEGDEMKWIPVSERLPEGDVRVLVLVNGAVDIACLNWQYGWMYEDYGSLEPSHWMPLPEPPSCTTQPR